MENGPQENAGKKRERSKEITLRIDTRTYAALINEAERQAIPPRTLARSLLVKAFRPSPAAIVPEPAQAGQ